MRCHRLGWLIGLVAMGAACSGSSSPGGGGGSGGGGSGGGTETVSCTTGGICTQVLVQSSGVAQEKSNCTSLLQGTVGTGCSPNGLTGCCKGLGGASMQEQCYYGASGTTLMIAKEGCSATHGTWSTTL